MKLDLTSFAFGYEIDGSAGNPNWATSFGQGVGYKINPDASMAEVVKGMIYKSCPLSSVEAPIGKGGKVYRGDDASAGIIAASLFDKVYVNKVLIKSCSLILIITKDSSMSHKGRLRLKYSPKIVLVDEKGAEVYSNETGINAIRDELGLKKNACWFVWDLNVVDQDQLHLSVCVVDKDKPCKYTSTAQLHTEWNNKIANVVKLSLYTKKDFLKDVFLGADEYDRLVDILNGKKNLVLQGAPGVGKTYAATRLAWSIMGVKNNTNISFVQFHQSYSYEDFVLGYKPDATGFHVETGAFFQACKQALATPQDKFFFIIDEINRGNLSRIFGELLMLIEEDKRGSKGVHKYSVKLPNAEAIVDDWDRSYALDFFVPDNLYIIGMMNTADRSLAMIDYALRRRFAFYEMVPAFDSAGFKAIKPDSSVPQTDYDGFIQKLKDLNEELSETFGTGFCIGHSYFCKAGLKKDQLKSIVEFEIYPMLKEYWFDDTTTPKKKYDDWKDKLIAALH